MMLSTLNEACAREVRGQIGEPELRLVFGEGQTEAPILFWIGEAPGEQEERQGRPFVGRAGINLDGFLGVLGVQRNAAYITNVVKFRPVQIGPTGRKRNRPPTVEEIAVFRPWLFEEIGLVQPRHLITLGNTPLKALMGKSATIGELHGIWQEWRGIKLYPMYHPASIIYRRELAEVCRNDLERLRLEFQPVHQ